MSKLDEVKEMLRNPIPGCSTNTEIATELDCDEGLVRKARPLVELEKLRAELIELRAKLENCRCGKPPRERRAKPEPLRSLWEHMEDGKPVPSIPMLGDE